MPGRPARLGPLAALAVALLASPARAGDVRPLGPPDAPEIDARARAPEVPPSFRSHAEPWLEVRYPPSTGDRIPALLTAAEQARGELAEVTGTRVLDRVEIRVARGPEELATLAPEGSPPPSGASAVAYASLRLVVVSLGTTSTSEPTDSPAAVRHALAHVALAEATGGEPVPAWLGEGLAVATAEEGALGRRARLASAALRGRLLPMGELDLALAAGGARASLAAAQAAELVRWLREDDRRVPFIALLERVHRGERFDRAFLDVYGESPASLDDAFRKRATARWGFLPAIAAIAAIALGTVLVGVRRARRPTAPPPATSTPVPRILAARRVVRRTRRPVPDADVPKVEHDGRWHTLH